MPSVIRCNYLAQSNTYFAYHMVKSKLSIIFHRHSCKGVSDNHLLHIQSHIQRRDSGQHVQNVFSLPQVIKLQPPPFTA